MLLETYFAFNLYFALIDICAGKQLLIFHLAVKVDLVEVVYYLKQVIYLLPNLYYCNSLFYGSPMYMLERIQKVQSHPFATDRLH